jgi:amino acid transporter
LSTLETNVETPVPPIAHGGLKQNAVGMASVIFMVLATAAPITAMTGNLPIAIGSGNGAGTPGAFLFATAVLAVFTVGYSAMARHVTATGAFYGFITRGLGRAAGLGAGLMATLAYMVFEGSLIGIFSSFFKTDVENFGGPKISWIVYALAGIAVIAALGYFEISISGKVLGVFLIGEVLILSALGLSVLFHGGGPAGLQVGSLNPGHAFTAVAGGSAAIGLFFAFWSWVGFETTAVYGEESRNPTRIIPRATLIVVIGLGLFYTFISWMTIAGNGPEQAIAVSNGSTGNAFDLFFGITQKFIGVWAKDVYMVLTVTGSFACALAFHNSASRYLYAFGRDELHPAVSPLGRTHPKHKSPHVASILQSVVTLAITLGFFWFQRPTKGAPDVPYYFEFGLLAIMGTMAILMVQAICSISVIWYFHITKHEAGSPVLATRKWWRTLLAPAVGALGMVYVVYLLFSHLSFAAGAAATSPVYQITPYVVIGVGVVGASVGLVLRAVSRARYERIGATVLADTTER